MVHPTVPPDIEPLVRRFSTGALPKAEWTHEAHLVVGLWFVAEYGAEGALPRLRESIRRLNEHHGVRNSEDSGYHETITRAYVHVLADFLATCPRELPLVERARLLLGGPIADRQFLLAFWSRDVLMSARARLEWVEPDLGPLALPHLGPTH